MIPRFDEQSGLDHADGVRRGALERGEILVVRRQHMGMNNRIEPRQAREVGEDNRCQFRAVHAAVGRQYPAAKFPHHVLEGRAARLDESVGNLIGFKDVTAEFAQHPRDSGLSCPDPARQPHAQHQGWTATALLICARRSRAAFTVLLISMAMVSGPTPPGTGVIAPATSATSGWTSPTSTNPFSRNWASFEGNFAKRRSASAALVIRLMPTSITAAPGRTQPGSTIAARPMAAMTMSARRTTSGRFRVFEWQMVTVAFACISSSAMGLPTMSLRPTTTASAPSIRIPLRRRISIAPAGVQATSPGRPETRRPRFDG